MRFAVHWFGSARNFLLPDLDLFLNLNGVEKPVLGRGLDSLIAGASGQEGRKAAEMLSSFQAKRTRVGKGLGAFLKGQQKIEMTGNDVQPAAESVAPARPADHQPVVPAPPAPEIAPTKAEVAPNPRVLRVQREPRSRSTAAKPRYRSVRQPRSQGPAPEPDKPGAASPVALADTQVSEIASPAESRSSAPANEEPAFQKPFVQERPAYLRRKPAPEPKTGEPKVSVSPNFRMTLLVIDWILIAGSFAVAWNLGPDRHVTLGLCVLGVVGGAVLGAWALSLEPEDLPEAPRREVAVRHGFEP